MDQYNIQVHLVGPVCSHRLNFCSLNSSAVGTGVVYWSPWGYATLPSLQRFRWACPCPMECSCVNRPLKFTHTPADWSAAPEIITMTFVMGSPERHAEASLVGMVWEGKKRGIWGESLGETYPDSPGESSCTGCSPVPGLIAPNQYSDWVSLMLTWIIASVRLYY